MQTLALNSSGLTEVVGRGFRKRFDWDFRKEDRNLFGKKIRESLRFIRGPGLILWDLAEESRIRDEKFGPTCLGLRCQEEWKPKIVEREKWLLKDKGRREQA